MRKRRNRTAGRGCHGAACSPSDSVWVDFRGNENHAPIIHTGKNGNPVRLIMGKNDDLVRHGIDAWLDLIDDSEPPP